MRTRVIVFFTTVIMLVALLSNAQNGDCDFVFNANPVSNLGKITHGMNSITIEWEYDEDDHGELVVYGIDLFRQDLSVGGGVEAVANINIHPSSDLYSYVDNVSGLNDQHNYRYLVTYRRTDGENQLNKTQVIGHVTVRIVPIPDIYFEVATTSEIDLPSKEYRAEVSVLLSNPEISGEIRKPFIIVDGFDPGNWRDFASTKIPNFSDNRGLFHFMDGRGKNGEEGPGFVDMLHENCFDVIFVNWQEGAGHIRDNAKLFKEVLHEINGRKITKERNIVVGPSMGGLISRICLAEMERDGIEHGTRMYISFDSPHLGGNIPLGIQHLMFFMSEKIEQGANSFGLSKPRIDQLDDAIKKLSSIAAKELLLGYWSETNRTGPPQMRPHPFRDNLMNHINSLPNGGWPVNLDKLAVSNGNMNGVDGVDFDGGTALVDVSEPSAADFAHVRCFSIGRSDGLIMEVKINTNIYAQHLYNNPLTLDNSPGGTLDVPTQLQSQVFWEEDVLPHNAAFIPTTSAFAYNEGLTQSSLFRSWEDPNNSPNASNTPFDKLFVQSCNEPHVWVNGNTAQWVVDQIIQEQGDVTIPLVEQQYTQVGFNQAFGNIVNLGNYDALKSFKIEWNGNFYASATESVILSPGFHSKYESQFLAQILDNELHLCSNGGYLKKGETLNVEALKTDVFEKQSFKTYPSPANNELNIEFDNSGYKTIELYDLTGKSLLRESGVVTNSIKLNVGGLMPGIYFLSVVEGEERAIVSKIVVK